MILLENKENLMPLSRNIQSIAVVGPKTRNHITQIGDCALLHDEKEVTNILQGITNILPKTARIDDAKDCLIREMLKKGFEETIDADKKSEVIVAVVGSFSVGIQYKKKGFLQGKRSLEADCGENVTKAILYFSGVQPDLLKELKALGKSLIIVLIHGRTISGLEINENAYAMIDASYPGEAGDTAVAEVIFGD